MIGTPVVQLANVADMSKTFTIFETPIWRASLWVEYEKNEETLPFMADEDTEYNRHAVQVQTIIIDFLEYLRVYDYQVLRDTDKSWMIKPDDPSTLYIHFENHNPPFAFFSFKNGVALGFSYGSSVLLGNIKTYPLLKSFPEIEDQADHFTYQRMNFESGKVVIDNSSGMLDDMMELFGNDLALLSFSKEKTLDVVRQYYIEKYTKGLSSVQLSVKDKRSRLTFKAPNTFYSRQEYPHIEESLLDTPIQDAYGYCKMVTGTCVNRNQIYQNVEKVTVEDVARDDFNDWFTFKFARTITRIDEVWVLMSDVWTQVFPGLGVPGNDDFADINRGNRIRIITKDATGNDAPVDVTPDNRDALPPNDGRIQIWWSQAMRDNPGHQYRRNGNANKVAMTGVFVNRNTAGEIVKDMMSYYGELPHDGSYFNVSEWEREMNQPNVNNQIGLVLDTPQEIFGWIEKIQNGAVLGFQLVVHKNLFSARVDNPNREETFDISWHEIANRDKLLLEMSGEMYATYTKINYLRDHANQTWKTVIDKSKRLDILEVYKFEKEYKNDSFLINKEDVVVKGNLVLESFMQVRPIIRNIELNGLREGEISLFSTGWIDFSVEIPKEMKAIQKFMKDRKHAGRMRVKVLGWRRDLKNDRIFIDVIQCDPLYALMTDISGEYPETVEYDKSFDNSFPETDEFDYVINSGRV